MPEQVEIAYTHSHKSHINGMKSIVRAFSMHPLFPSRLPCSRSTKTHFTDFGLLVYAKLLQHISNSLTINNEEREAL